MVESSIVNPAGRRESIRIGSGSHLYGRLLLFAKSGEIIIGDGVWIGANVVVTRNVTIGAHSIVAAGAVVTRDVEPYSIVAGVPATLVRRRD